MAHARAIIVAEGPNAVGYQDEWGRDAIVIGVNAVVERFICDWWVFADGGGFMREARGEPLICTRAMAVRSLWEAGRPWEDRINAAIGDRRVTFHREVKGIPWRCGLMPWYTKSGTLALGLAIHLGCLDIECYGVDMQGDGDFRGHVESTRTIWRWQEERRAWAELVRIVRGRGGRVVRKTRSVSVKG